MAVTFDAKSAPPSGQKTVDHRARDLRQALLECLLVIPAVALLEFGFYYLASALGWQPAAIKLAAGGIVLATAAGMIAGIFFPQVRKTVWQALAPILLAQVILLIGDALADGLGLNKYLMCLAGFAIFMVASILAGAFHRPEGRQLVWQALLIVLIVLLFEMIIFNTVASLKKANIASGFDFYRDTAKFDIGLQCD